MTDLLSDEFLAGLETSLPDFHDLQKDDVGNLPYVERHVYEAARAFHALAPLLREWVEGRKISTDGEWIHNSGPSLKGRYQVVEVEDYMVCECWEGDDERQREDDAKFIALSANTATKIKDILGGGV